MLAIDLTGKRALVAGVADDAGFGFAIAKALAEAGAKVCVGTWPPALNIFENLLRRGEIDEARKPAPGGGPRFRGHLPPRAAPRPPRDAARGHPPPQPLTPEGAPPHPR